MTFPMIGHLNDLLPYIQGKKEIRLRTEPNGTQVVTYMISMPETFDSDYTRECRRITFDSNGVIISRHLHKFFNVGERESTYRENLDWSQVIRVMAKLDGSMLSTVPLDGKVVLKSKKAFETDVAVKGTAWLNAHPNYLEAAHDIAYKGLTAIFEWTSPGSRIVLKYPHDQLTLLHVRENVSGEYLLPEELEEICIDYGLSLVEADHGTNQSLEKIIQICESAVDIEGFVVQFESGEMVKFKTASYVDLHRTITFIRERDIALMVCLEKIDDMKALLLEQGIDMTKILLIEKRVLNRITEIQEYVEQTFTDNAGLSRKEYAIKLTGQPHFKLLMDRYVRGDADYVGYYRDKLLPDEFLPIQI